MSAVSPSPVSRGVWRQWWLTVLFGWVLLAIAAFVYASRIGAASRAAIAVAAGFLLEFPAYLLMGFERPVAAIRTWQKHERAALLVLTAAVPWIACYGIAGMFAAPQLVILLAIAGCLAFWYVTLPQTAFTDALFLMIAAGLLLSRVFDVLYPTPIPKTSISILGHLMLIHVASGAILLVRPGEAPPLRFVPAGIHWRTGCLYFAALVPIVGAAYYALGLATLRQHPLNAGLAAGTFLGILWVVALSEEYFFRGLLMPSLEKWTGSFVVALILSSILFGSVHLGYRFHGDFPNWRFSAVAGMAGVFYGLAARKAGIQASMITHACTVTLWRVFLH